MSFCSNCGTQFQGNNCPNCGTPAQPQQQQQQPYQQPYQQQQQPYQQPYQQQPYQQAPAAVPGKGLAIAALVLAIIGVLVSLYFMTNWITVSNEESSGSSVAEAIEDIKDMLLLEYDDMEELRTSAIVTAVFWAAFGVAAIVLAMNAKKKGYISKMNTASNIMGYANIAMAAVSIFLVIDYCGRYM